MSRYAFLPIAGRKDPGIMPDGSDKAAGAAGRIQEILLAFQPARSGRRQP